MKNFKVISVTPKQSTDGSYGDYFLLIFSYDIGFFRKKSVCEELMIKIIDDYNIKVVGGGNFTEKEQQQIFVAIAKQ